MAVQKQHSVMATGSDVLDKIMAHKAQEVEYAKSTIPLTELIELAKDVIPPRGFVDALATSLQTGKSAVIAEVKKASPSKGVIREDFDPIDIALKYQTNGASCLSVLTDHQFFQGSAEIFRQVREICNLPMLRKDFMLDLYQVYEAKTMGADCILLIAAALEDGLMQDLAGLAQEQGLDVLIEVHNQAELERSLQFSLPMIGINNRNLRNFDTSLQTTIGLLDLIDDNIIVITESGIHTHEDVHMMREHEVNSFLVGEALMRADDPGARLSELFF